MFCGEFKTFIGLTELNSDVNIKTMPAAAIIRFDSKQLQFTIEYSEIKLKYRLLKHGV